MPPYFWNFTIISNRHATNGSPHSIFARNPRRNLNHEFKRLAGEKFVEKIVETIVAFANADGGTLVLGIDDPEKTKFKGEARIFGIEENRPEGFC